MEPGKVPDMKTAHFANYTSANDVTILYSPQVYDEAYIGRQNNNYKKP